MKTLALILSLSVLIPTILKAQGSTCATAITLTLDGVLRNYTTSSGTGANVVCTSSGTTPVTWFRFTTNAAAECPLLNLTIADSTACEVAFYTSCSSFLTSSSMCFYDGYGLWAPNENLNLLPNTVYYLRIKTTTSGTIRIAGQHFTPPNDNCFGARSIGADSIYDNNACHHAGPGVTPAQLCALTLENTAWYQFYVVTTGYSIVNIRNIHCNNGASNNNTGFQIGFFTGTCSTLTWVNCQNGSGTFVQATTALLTAGTKVYVAIDGISGSNCSYMISGYNIVGVLSGNLKNFSGWKTTHANKLYWTTLVEPGGYYIIEKSSNGTDFFEIGRVQSRQAGTTEVSYNFEDQNPHSENYYRLKQVDAKGYAALSNIIFINRTDLLDFSVRINNPAGNSLDLNVSAKDAGSYQFSIFNMQGQKIKSQSYTLIKGNNRFSMNLSNIPVGQYALIIGNENKRLSKLFIKAYQ